MSDMKLEALAAVGLDKLPEKSSKKFNGKAVAKVKKVSGKEVYVLVHWDEKSKNFQVARDFCRGMIDSKEGMEIYPDPKNIALTAKEILDNVKSKLIEFDYAESELKGWNTAKCNKELEKVIIAKQELADLGVADAKGTLEELTKMKSDLSAGSPED